MRPAPALLRALRRAALGGRRPHGDARVTLATRRRARPRSRSRRSSPADRGADRLWSTTRRWRSIVPAAANMLAERQDSRPCRSRRGPAARASRRTTASHGDAHATSAAARPPRRALEMFDGVCVTPTSRCKGAARRCRRRRLARTSRCRSNDAAGSRAPRRGGTADGTYVLGGETRSRCRHARARARRSARCAAHRASRSCRSPPREVAPRSTPASPTAADAVDARTGHGVPPAAPQSASRARAEKCHGPRPTSRRRRTEVGHTRQTAELLQPVWGDRFAYGRPITALAAREVEIKLELIHDSPRPTCARATRASHLSRRSRSRAAPPPSRRASSGRTSR